MDQIDLLDSRIDNSWTDYRIAKSMNRCDFLDNDLLFYLRATIWASASEFAKAAGQTTGKEIFHFKNDHCNWFMSPRWQ